jgi:hypothetical protein
MEVSEKEVIYSVNFNQDNGCFIVSTSSGIRVFNTYEFGSTFFRGKIKLRLNIIANIISYRF